MAIIWSDEYATGNDRIDAQHRRLFDYANRLEETTELDEVTDSQVEELLGFLEAWVNIHFCFEELCMAMSKCQAAEANKCAHNKFLEVFEAFQVEFKTKGASKELIGRLYKTIDDWIVRHILKIDSQLAAEPTI